MSVTGAIADRTRAILPVVWDALSGDSRFGDGAIQSTIDTVKSRVFGSVSATAAESSYALIVIDYVAKLVAIELLTPAIDFFANQPLTESATGTNENHTFIDRAAELRLLRESLIAETRLLKPDVAPIINYTPLSSAPRPLSNTINDDFLTPSPQEFPRPYRRTSFS